MEEFKSFFKKVKWDSILIAVLTIATGILCVSLPGATGDVLCIVFGSFLIAMSVALFIRYFSVGRLFGTHLLVCSAVTLILGLFCLIYPNAIQGILTVLFGLFIVVDSISTLSESIYCAKAKIKGWPAIFVLSILTIALGIGVMFSTFETVMIFAGCSLIIEGVKRLVLTLTFSHKIRQAKKEINKQLEKENDIIIE